MLNNLLLGQTAEEKLYVEDVFSTWLYTDNGSTNTITNGIDLSGKGGLVWAKPRSAAYQHEIYDTARGNYRLTSDSAGAQANMTGSGYGIGFTSTGFTIGSANTNTTYVSWTFRKSPKFFDVVTWTGNSTSNRAISHSLGVVPGLIIIKKLGEASDWVVWHRSLTSASHSMYLNTTAAQSNVGLVGPASPTSTAFTVAEFSAINEIGFTYVAYLFAHDTTADGIVQCGSYTGGGATNTSVNLGWEPQYVLIKSASVASQWAIYDNMRGVFVNGADALLYANLSNAEANTADYIDFNATGFTTKVDALATNSSGQTYIYLAIRRGPMRVPIDATKVFKPVAYTGDGTATKKLTTDFPVDLGLIRKREASHQMNVVDRLRGIGTVSPVLYTSETWAEGASNYAIADNTSYQLGNGTTRNNNDSGVTYIGEFFRRAPGFFDVTCYSGTGAARTVSHNLGVKPNLIILKNRTGTANSWYVYSSDLTATKRLTLPGNAGASTNTIPFNNTEPTTTNFTLGANIQANNSGDTYVAYLFATCAGVSKVGSYTGNGSSLNVDCGFTNGARFVLIKRTDSTGDWYVWDTARGIVAANDPWLLLNSANAEVTTDDSIDPLSTGFTVNQVAATNINVNAATYIFLAIS